MAAFLISSELEYIIIVIRSVYDLLQKLSKQCARLVHSTKNERLINELPDSFANVVMSGSETLCEKDIMEKYGLPAQLAEFYAGEAQRFKILRDLRVSIEHHGKSVTTIFDDADGMAVKIDEDPWKIYKWKSMKLSMMDIGLLSSMMIIFYSIKKRFIK